MSHFMSGFPEDTRAKLMYMHEQMKQGMTPQAAAKASMAMQLQEAGMSPQQKAAVAESTAKEDLKTVNEITPMSMLSEWGKKFHSMFPTQGGKEAANELAALPKGTLWGDNPRASEEAAAQYRLEIMKGAERIRQSAPHLTSESAIRLAKADIAGRTIMTENGGPLILPYGTDAAKKFGLDQSQGNVSNERIGLALDSMYKPEKGNNARFKLDVQGNLTVEEFNKAGQRVKSPITMDSTEVGKKVNEMRQAEAEKYAAEKGHGVVRVDPESKQQVQFNGDNTVGVDSGLMFKLRDSLVKHEGVRSTPYEDLSGKVVDGKKIQTVGVGVSSHNPYYPKVQADGTVAPQDIATSFKLASNSAADSAKRILQATGLQQAGPRGEAGFMLFGELAYQSGGKFDSLRSYGDMIKAIKLQDYDQALAALKSSPAYGWSGAVRKNHYETQLRPLIKG
jgi:hypothetical protein